MKISLLWPLLLWLALHTARAQFLFTYEINQEEEGGRAPKSSLFDPNSFKIVTPAQLQSSYQKISAQLGETASGHLRAPAPVGERPPARNAPEQPPSLLKQTSQALQSFAELFSLTSPAPGPLPAAALPHQHQLDQQAEARSLQEHWQQQQQRSHHQPASSHSQQLAAGPALSSFTTATSHQQVDQQHQHQPQPHQHQASYWLAGSPMGQSQADANFLVAVKQPAAAHRHQLAPEPQQAEFTSPSTTLIDNLLSVGHHSQPQPQPQPAAPKQQPAPPQAQPQPQQRPAQASFLSTPTSQYPAPTSRQQPVLAPRPAPRPSGEQASDAEAPPQQPLEMLQMQQLRPPVNLPAHFGHGQPMAQSHQFQHHKSGSAEDTLAAFRQQQQQAASSAPTEKASRDNDDEDDSEPQNQNQRPQPLQKQAKHHQSGASNQIQDIPKVSPQIYESFLLQRKDQQEKHMELLKQQQELNRLMEERRRQQQQDQEKMEREKREHREKLEREKRRKRKQEELEKAEKLEREKRRQREQLERKLREEQEERRRREAEEAEAREKELKERERQEELARQRLRLEEEQRWAKLAAAAKLQREKEEAEARAAAEAKAAEAKAAEAKAAETKAAGYLRGQQEELRKFLELKRQEDERTQEERRQRHQGVARSPTSGWGAPVRAQRLGNGPPSSSAAPAGWSGETVASSSTTAAPTTTSAAETPARPQRARRVNGTPRVVAKRRPASSNGGAGGGGGNRPRAGDERLIKQKIPLYTGAGKYGLYMGQNNSMANDLAALLDSVQLPPTTTTSTAPSTSTSSTSTSTSSTTSSTTSASTQAPGSSEAYERLTSSLSPLLAAGLQPAFDDDVPRRPARTLQQQPSAAAAAAPTPAPPARHSHRDLNQANQTSGAGSRRAHIGLASLPPDSDNDGIPGRAGQEYPVLAQVPPTSFSCGKQPLNGYYADTETACQVVHLCQAGSQSSILCPNGTIFNQEKFSCQWWYEVNCSRAPMFYQLNDNLYRGPALGAGAAPGDEPRPRKRLTPAHLQRA